MMRNETPRERYEDALFALLMEDMLEAEGRKAREENQRLKQDPDAAVPPEMRKRCLRVINQHYNRQSVRRAGRVASRLVSRIAVIILIVAALFVTALATNPELRSKTMNLLVEVLDDRTVIQFTDEETKHTGTQFDVVEFTWFPEEYVLASENVDSRRKESLYTSPDGDKITVSISTANNTNTKVALDTEASSYENIHLPEQDILLIEKGSETQVFWTELSHNLFVKLVGNNIERETLIHIAKSVVIH